MQRVRIQGVTAAGVALLAMGLSLSACGSSGGSSSSSGGSSSSSSALTGTLNSSGSTFQLTFQQAAISAFKSVQSGMTVNYGGGGSGKGRTDLAAGTVNFAGSDSPIPPAETANFKGKTVLYFPVITGPITMSYNLSGVSKLQADPDGHRGHFPGQDQGLERPGHQGDQPGRHPAQHPDHARRALGFVGHDAELLAVPHGRRAERVEARQQLHHHLALQRARRQRQRRGGADRQDHPRRHRVRGLRHRQGLRAELRVRPEQARASTSRPRRRRPPRPRPGPRSRRT